MQSAGYACANSQHKMRGREIGSHLGQRASCARCHVASGAGESRKIAFAGFCLLASSPAYLGQCMQSKPAKQANVNLSMPPLLGFNGAHAPWCACVGPFAAAGAWKRSDANTAPLVMILPATSWAAGRPTAEDAKRAQKILIPRFLSSAMPTRVTSAILCGPETGQLAASSVSNCCRRLLGAETKQSPTWNDILIFRPLVLSSTCARLERGGKFFSPPTRSLKRHVKCAAPIGLL